MPTTAVCNTFKQELMMGAHNFLAVVAVTFSNVSGQFTLTGGASTAGLKVGMAISGNANIPAGTVIASVDSATQVTMSKASTGTITTQSITFTGDQFNFLLIKLGFGGTYDQTLINVGTPGSGAPTTTNVGTDEVSGAGYTANGFALTNISPSLSTNTATISFSVNPSWTSASFSTVAGVLYNTQAKALGSATAALTGNRSCSVHDFGGTQTVAAGTFTAVLPTNNAANAILRIA